MAYAINDTIVQWIPCNIAVDTSPDQDRRALKSTCKLIIECAYILIFALPVLDECSSLIDRVRSPAAGVELLTLLERFLYVHPFCC